MTARAQPSRASHYVSMVLAPLHQFLQVGPGFSLLWSRESWAAALPTQHPVWLVGPQSLPEPAAGTCMHAAAPDARCSLLRPPPQAEAAAQLGGEARAQLAQAVAAGVSARYLHLADDTLRWGEGAHLWALVLLVEA